MKNGESVSEDFFRHLAARLYKEPGLSDVTYAILEAVPDFKMDFVRFFYPELPTDQAIMVNREYPLPGGDGQPDFAFHTPSWGLIVENKLWDTNYHFGQYRDLGNGTTTYLGVIANHRVSSTAKSKGWAIRSWEQFIKEFENRRYGDSTELFRGYVRYVREVCGVKNLSAVNFAPGSLRSLYSFNCMVERILKQSADERFEVTIQYNYLYNFGEGWSGYYFTLRRRGTDSTLMPYFGIDYLSEPPFIHVYIDKGTKDYRKIVQNLAESDQYEKSRGKVNGDCLWLKMPPGTFKRLNREESVDNQLEVLGSFFANCCHALVKAWSRVD